MTTRLTTRPTKRTAHALRGAAFLAALFVAGCGTPAPTTPAPTPDPLPTQPPPTLPVPTSVPTPLVSPPAFACGAIVGRPGSVPVARISGMAAANEAGIGRITFTFRAEGNVAAIPQVEVRPALPPFTMDPSGLPLDVTGTAFVVITLHGGTALDEEYNPTYEGPFDFTPGGSPIVEVRRAGDFEAVSSWVVGLTGPPCVRILPPDGSGRLVIEIREG